MLLAIEFFDELVFGVREIAWPSIRRDLGLSYVEIGVLLSVPELIACVAEPVLALARNRRRVILAGALRMPRRWPSHRSRRASSPAALGLVNADWYAIPMARLYSALPGRSGSAVAASSFAGLVGWPAPVLLGALAGAVGLGPAMWALLLGPIGVLLLLPRASRRRDRLSRRRPPAAPDRGPATRRARRFGRPRAGGH